MKLPHFRAQQNDGVLRFLLTMWTLCAFMQKYEMISYLANLNGCILKTTYGTSFWQNPVGWRDNVRLTNS